MSVAECYDLSVQCDGEHVLPVRSDFTGENRREAHAAMRKAGWKLGPYFTAYCSRCRIPSRADSRAASVKESDLGNR